MGDALDGGADRELSPLGIRVFALVFRADVACTVVRIESLFFMSGALRAFYECAVK